MTEPNSAKKKDVLSPDIKQICNVKKIEVIIKIFLYLKLIKQAKAIIMKQILST